MLARCLCLELPASDMGNRRKESVGIANHQQSASNSGVIVFVTVYS